MLTDMARTHPTNKRVHIVDACHVLKMGQDTIVHLLGLG